MFGLLGTIVNTAAHIVLAVAVTLFMAVTCTLAVLFTLFAAPPLKKLAA